MARFDRKSYALIDEPALWYDGIAAARAGRPVITGTAGNDRLTGTAAGETFRISQGGADTLHGGGGNDRFFFGESYTDKDVIDGGGGRDVLFLEGTRDKHLVLGPDNLSGVELVRLAEGNYRITLQDGVSNLILKTASLAPIFVDSSLVSKANFRLSGSDRGDMIVGGGGDDLIRGRGGSDHLVGGLGDDSFVYLSPSDSSKNIGIDIISDFGVGDRIIISKKLYDYGELHIAESPGQAGNVVISRDEEKDYSIVSVYLTDDQKVDYTIYVHDTSIDFKIDNGNIVMA
jgi:Ca2+-binding RTX toxin-like protein